MPVPPRLFKKLHETLGDEAEDLVNWMHQIDGQRSELRESIRADFAELRQEMHAGFGRLESNLLKWSFVFWVAAVTAIAALAGALN